MTKQSDLVTLFHLWMELKWNYLFPFSSGEPTLKEPASSTGLYDLLSDASANSMNIWICVQLQTEQDVWKLKRQMFIQNSDNEQFIKNNFICPGVLLSMRVTAD